MFHLDPKIESASAAAMESCVEAFARIEENTEYNQQKMLAAFIHNGVSESHFAGTTGYGYDDRGRDTDVYKRQRKYSLSSSSTSRPLDRK